MAAVVSAFFTVFIKTDGDGSPVEGLAPQAGPNGPNIDPKGELALGSGTIAELGVGESLETVNPNRPNANFDPFFLAVIRQIGIALGIPYEVLIMHFSSSYTASKAALETARQFFSDRRNWLSSDFCQPTFEWFVYECVLRGVVDAPGFIEDPIARAAWCGLGMARPRPDCAGRGEGRQRRRKVDRPGRQDGRASHDRGNRRRLAPESRAARPRVPDSDRSQHYAGVAGAAETGSRSGRR
jgi:hypothetical protein